MDVWCFWCIAQAHTLTHIHTLLQLTEIKYFAPYLVSLTFSPSGSNEIVIRFTAFKLSNRKFLAIADIKPPDRLSDPVYGKDILSVYVQKIFWIPLKWWFYFAANLYLVLEINVYCIEQYEHNFQVRKKETFRQIHIHTLTHNSMWNSMSKACVFTVIIVYSSATTVRAPLTILMRN